MPAPSRHDYDTPWKDALTRYLPDFLAFYFPAAHAAIDWARPHVFLDQELAQICHDSALGRRLADKLVQVPLRGGSAQWVLLHLEVQAGRDRSLAERVFTCNYRSYERYRRPVASLVLLADASPRWRPHQFCYRLLGSEMRLQFALAKLRDYAPRLPALLDEDNPFALVTAAHLMAQRSRRQPLLAYAAKRYLIRLLYRRQWGHRRIMDLLQVIDWILCLPAELELELRSDIQEMEGECTMPYVSSFERIGRQIGRQEGLQEGLQEGRAELLGRLLARRFGPLPAAAQSRLEQASAAQVLAWSERLFDAATLDEIWNGEGGKAAP